MALAVAIAQIKDKDKVTGICSGKRAAPRWHGDYHVATTISRQKSPTIPSTHDIIILAIIPTLHLSTDVHLAFVRTIVLSSSMALIIRHQCHKMEWINTLIPHNSNSMNNRRHQWHNNGTNKTASDMVLTTQQTTTTTTPQWIHGIDVDTQQY